jgi:hypothetical protein
VSQENDYGVAASKAVVEIRSVQHDVEVSLSAASTTLESCVFTLMPVFALFILTVGGCCFVTDSQRARLDAFWKFVIKSWNRLAHTALRSQFPVAILSASAGIQRYSTQLHLRNAPQHAAAHAAHMMLPQC